MSECVSDFRMRLCGFYQNTIDYKMTCKLLDKLEIRSGATLLVRPSFTTSENKGGRTLFFSTWFKGPALTSAMLAAEWAGRWNPRRGLSDMQMSSSGQGREDGTEPSQDLAFWENIDFLFYVKVSKSFGKTDVGKVLDDNLMAAVFPEMYRTQRLRFLAEVLTSKRSVVLVDELDELSGTVLSRCYDSTQIINNSTVWIRVGCVANAL